MFQAACLGRDSRIPLPGHDLKFSDDVYNYVVSRTSDGVTLSAKSRTESISADVGWAFGVSESSQTYLLKREDTFVESRLSYFQSLMGLDITFGHSSAAPSTSRWHSASRWRARRYAAVLAAIRRLPRCRVSSILSTRFSA